MVKYHDFSDGYIPQMSVISVNNLPLISSGDLFKFRSVLQHLFRQYNLLIYVAAKLNLLSCLKCSFKFAVNPTYEVKFYFQGKPQGF